MNAAKPDVGREAVTKDLKDRGKFKTPGLRNVAKTYPYMHDGETPTLEAVVDLHNKGESRTRTLTRLSSRWG